MNLIFSLLLMFSLGFAASRNENLKVIVEKNFLEPQCEPFLNMIAVEAIAESEKQIDSAEVVDHFRKNFSDEKILAKFFKPYSGVFSDEEVQELRKIHDNPTWQKYYREGMPILQAQV